MYNSIPDINVIFMYDFVKGWTLNNLFSLIVMYISINAKDETEAIAAPTVPYGGIKIKFRIIFKPALIMEQLTNNLDFPAHNNV